MLKFHGENKWMKYKKKSKISLKEITSKIQEAFLRFWIRDKNNGKKKKNGELIAL